MNIHANTEPSRLSDEHTVNFFFFFLKGSCTLSCGGGIFSTHAWRLPSVEAVCQMDVVTDTWELVVFLFCFSVFLFLLLGSWSGFAGWMDVALNRCQLCCYDSCYNRD